MGPGRPLSRDALSDEQVRKIRKLAVEQSLTYATLAQRFGIHQHSVSLICRGKLRPEAGGPLVAASRRGATRQWAQDGRG